MNLYEYVRSRPTVLTDPGGRVSVDPAAPEDVRKAFDTLAGDPIGQHLLNHIRAAEASTRDSVTILGRPMLSTTGSRSDNRVRNGRLTVYIDSRDAVGIDEHGTVIMSKATGDGRCDVELGIPLDEVMFHELTHALHVLTGTDRWAALPPGIRPGTRQDDDFRERWVNLEEYNTVKDENVYNKSRGYSVRFRYRNTDEQNDELDFMASKLMQSRFNTER